MKIGNEEAGKLLPAMQFTALGDLGSQINILVFLSSYLVF